MKSGYRGRIAPSPTGFLHLGHARTFWTAQQRARESGGTLVLRNDDLDAGRCKPEFAAAMYEDLRWFGFHWDEGPDIGGSFGPYDQSRRMNLYRAALDKLEAGNFVYPCTCSRKDIQQAVTAPHAEDNEPIYPGTCRHKSTRTRFDFVYRFRVPDGEMVSFCDANFGEQIFEAGKDFGDFVVWSHRGANDTPAYQLACAVDDAAMQITEVVRGADLLLSTARQLLFYRALGITPPKFFHSPLVLDSQGRRLAKRHDALSLRHWRAAGRSPEAIRAAWA